MTQREPWQGLYEQSITIHASADTVFDFVSNISNLPKYLPTVQNAQPQVGERVRVQGEAAGQRYDSDGYLHAEKESYRLEWGADEDYYAGQLLVRPLGDGSSTVTVRLSFRGEPPGSDPKRGPTRNDIEEGIRAALESINTHLTGTGGKQEPPTATS